METNRFNVQFRLLSGIRWLIAIGERITTSACYIFQNYIRYSLCKTYIKSLWKAYVSIRKYFSFNTVLRIGKTSIIINIIFAKIKMLQQHFPPLSAQIPAFSYWSLWSRTIRFKWGCCIIMSTYRLHLCIQILAFSRKVCQFKSKTGTNFFQYALCDLDRFQGFGKVL